MHLFSHYLEFNAFIKVEQTYKDKNSYLFYKYILDKLIGLEMYFSVAVYGLF